MLKEFYDYVKQVVALAQDVSRSKERVTKLEQQVEELTAIVQRLVYEMQSDRKQAQHDKQQAEKDQEILMLRLELALEREGKRLPAPPEADINPSKDQDI